MTPKVILCADDYAITEGVSDAIDALVAAGRLSATSALVTGRHWPSLGTRLAHLRGRAAIGLHLNLTLGSPLGAMPELAPDGRFPAIGTLTQRALSGQIDAKEVAGEFSRQIAAFTSGTGHSPDFVDGHQHVHSLRGVRDGLLAALRARAWTAPPLIRNPADSPLANAWRGVALTKATSVGMLAVGFGRRVRAAGFPTNHGFSGFSDFQLGTSYETELRQCFAVRGARPLVMCHPGFPDTELASLDPLTDRRREEFDGLMSADWLDEELWRPDRDAGNLWGPA